MDSSCVQAQLCEIKFFILYLIIAQILLFHELETDVDLERNIHNNNLYIYDWHYNKTWKENTNIHNYQDKMR